MKADGRQQYAVDQAVDEVWVERDVFNQGEFMALLTVCYNTNCSLLELSKARPGSNVLRSIAA